MEQNKDYVNKFISAKRIEGCSEKSLFYYENTINAMLSSINKNIKHIATDDLRLYLTEYQKKNEISKVTLDNIRRILSSFFSWLEDEAKEINKELFISMQEQKFIYKSI